MRNARWDVIGIAGGQWYPIYLAYCTGLLEINGHEVKLLDAQVDGLTREETYRIAKEFSPNLIVLYYSYKALKNDLEIGKQLHNLTGGEIVLVGPSASINPIDTLKMSSGINMLAKGEFDYTVLELAEAVLKKDQIKGLIWKESNGTIHINPERKPVQSEELDKFPFVTDVYRRHLHINNYNQADQFHPFIDLFTGRGCSWGLCTFCLWPNTINKDAGYRTRSISNVIEELRFIKEQMPYIKEVFFQDDTLPAPRAYEISKAILDNKIRIRWSCYARPTADMNINTLKLMKKAGCRTMHVGYESANPQILKNICKGTSIKTAEEFTKNACAAGLYIVGDFLTGLPGENIDTIKATVEWARKLPVQRYTFSLPKPYPETPLYKSLQEIGYLKEGHPNYPGLSAEEIYVWNKWSYRKVYLSPNYFFRMIIKPQEWDRIARSAVYAVPYFFNKESGESKKLEW